MFANTQQKLNKVSLSRNNEEIFEKELLPHIEALKTYSSSDLEALLADLLSPLLSL